MAEYTSNLNLKKPDGAELMSVLDINGNMDLIDAAFGDVKDLKVNISTFTSVASLVTYIQGASISARLMVSMDDAIGATFFGGSTSTNFTMIVYKASENNAYFWAFARDKVACGNIALGDGTVTIKWSSDNTGVTDVASIIADKECSSGSTAAVGSISLNPGEYIITVTGRWTANASGSRDIWISDTAGGGTAINLASETLVAPANGSTTRQQLTFMYKATAATTLYIVAKQSSGSTLTLSTRYSIARIR